MPVSRLADKVCVVNGAASEIGQAVAGRFASEGAVVVGVDKVEHSVGEHAVQADLADESQVEAMYEHVVRRYGRLDVIYNNMRADGPGDRSALDIRLETWRRVHNANLTSIFLSCKHSIRHLLNTRCCGGHPADDRQPEAGVHPAVLHDRPARDGRQRRRGAALRGHRHAGEVLAELAADR